MKPAPERILVIMPALNEVGRIGSVIKSIVTVLPEADIVVVNDGSSDATGAEAMGAGATVLPHAVPMGYGASLETAYLYAAQKQYDIVLQMDSDGQHLGSELPVLLNAMRAGAFDIVIGSRYAAADSVFRTSFFKRLGQRFFGGLLLILTGRRFSDPTSGFQGLNRRAIRFFSSGVFPCDYPDADVLLMAHEAGLRLGEVPVRMVSRSGGSSMHDGWKPLYYGMKMLLSLFIVRLNTSRWRRWKSGQES
jgi:glycosyltransferase involved in cell wall biosynthesis